MFPFFVTSHTSSTGSPYNYSSSFWTPFWWRQLLQEYHCNCMWEYTWRPSWNMDVWWHRWWDLCTSYRRQWRRRTERTDRYRHREDTRCTEWGRWETRRRHRKGFWWFQPDGVAGVLWVSYVMRWWKHYGCWFAGGCCCLFHSASRVGPCKKSCSRWKQRKKVDKVNEITINYSHLRHYFIAIKNSAFEIWLNLYFLSNLGCCEHARTNTIQKCPFILFNIFEAYLIFISSSL